MYEEREASTCVGGVEEMYESDPPVLVLTIVSLQPDSCYTNTFQQLSLSGSLALTGYYNALHQEMSGHGLVNQLHGKNSVSNVELETSRNMQSLKTQVFHRFRL